MIFGYAKMIMVGVLVAGIAGAGFYVMKLQKDNAILKANQIKLEQSVESQKKVFIVKNFLLLKKMIFIIRKMLTAL